MGCDIHLYVEVNRREKDDKYDRWSLVTPSLEVVDEWGGGSSVIRQSFYDNRNYSAFAILADVRNGHGLAGIDTGDGYLPLAAPKGLPEDVSEQVRRESDRWGCDGHSHSWFSLPDLRATDDYWNQTTNRRGVVSPEQEAELAATGEHPTSWCVDVSPLDPERHRRVEWQVTYREAGSDLLDLAGRLGRLRFDLDWGLRLGRRLEESDIRIVFWFDN